MDFVICAGKTETKTENQVIYHLTRSITGACSHGTVHRQTDMGSLAFRHNLVIKQVTNKKGECKRRGFPVKFTFVVVPHEFHHHQEPETRLTSDSSLVELRRSKIMETFIFLCIFMKNLNYRPFKL